MQCGRRGLASLLAEYERRASEKVALYLRLRLYDAALGVAVESAETEVVYSVVVQLLHQLMAAQSTARSDAVAASPSVRLLMWSCRAVVTIGCLVHTMWCVCLLLSLVACVFSECDCTL